MGNGERIGMGHVVGRGRVGEGARMYVLLCFTTYVYHVIDHPFLYLLQLYSCNGIVDSKIDRSLTYLSPLFCITVDLK